MSPLPKFHKTTHNLSRERVLFFKILSKFCIKCLHYQNFIKQLTTYPEKEFFFLRF